MRSNQMLNIYTEALPMSKLAAVNAHKKGGMLEKIIFVRIESANYLNKNQGNWHSK